MTAILEQTFRMGRLKIVDPDLTARDVRGDGKDGCAVALTIKQSIDQMQVARATTAGTNGKFSRQLSFSSCRERGALLVPHMDPVDRFLPPHRIGNSIELVTDDYVAALAALLLSILHASFTH